MEKTKPNKKKIWIPLLAVLACAGLVAGFVFGRQAMEKQQEEKSWTEAYIAQSAYFPPEFDKLPQTRAEWETWYEQADMPNINKMLGDDNQLLGENRLYSLMGSYSTLAQVNIANPEEAACRELFEALTPYYEKAFVWEGGTTPKQCLDRLKSLSTPGALEAIDTLCQQAGELYHSTRGWWSVSSSGNLQQGVREYVTSSGDIVTVPEYVSTYGDLQEYEYVSSNPDLQVNP